MTFSFEADKALDELYIFNEESRRVYHGVEYNTVNALYGANASGKSTLLQAIYNLYALNAFFNMGSNEAWFQVYKSCFYDETLPIIFELEYIPCKAKYFPEEIVIYTLEIAFLTDEKVSILKEELKTEKHLIFKREFDMSNSLDSLYKYEFGTEIALFESEEQDRIKQKVQSPFNLLCYNAFLEVLEPYRLVLHSDYNQFFRLFDFMYKSDDKVNIIRLVKKRLDNSQFKQRLLNLCKLADFNIEDVVVQSDQLWFVHSNRKGIPFEAQSDGTQKFFLLFATTFLLEDKDSDKEEHPKTFYIDELEKSLHYNLASAIIDIFRKKETNPHGHRLVFTTHDTRFLHPSFVHGDQVWFISRDNDTDETLLESPVEYKDFDPFHLDKAYLRGAYSGVPNTKFDDEPLEI
ncbi:MAG: AAA family ATPase [Vampirovibrionales bacterium]